MNICIKTIMVLASIVISNLTVSAPTKDFEHHAYLAGDTLKCSAAEASGYNDFHGCKISDIYNIVDTCCLETGDEKNTAAYHLAILSPDYLDGRGWNLYSDRVLLIRKGDDTFIYDNVISNEIYDARHANGSLFLLKIITMELLTGLAILSLSIVAIKAVESSGISAFVYWMTNGMSWD